MWRDPYSYLAEFTGASVLPANGQLPVQVPIDREGDFELYRLAVLATSLNFRVQFSDQESRLFSNQFMPATTILGNGRKPYRLNAAHVIKRTNTLRVTAIDRSGAGNTVRVLLVGAQLSPGPPFIIPPFGWGEEFDAAVNFGAETTDDFAAVPANGNAEGGFRLPGDSWYEVRTMTIGRTGAATIQILTNGAREWFRNPVHVDLLGGNDFTTAEDSTAQWPFEFTPPKLLQPNTSITVRLADLSGAGNPIRVVFHGVRRYPSQVAPAPVPMRRRRRRR